MTIIEQLKELLAVDGNGFRACPVCNSSMTVDVWGTQYDVECDGCGQFSLSVQISDFMTIDERMSCPVLSAENDFTYPDIYLKKAHKELIGQDTRAADPLIQAAIDRIVELEKEVKRIKKVSDNYYTIAHERDAVIEVMREALEDSLSGYTYIRDHLTDDKKRGIGYSRCIDKCKQALSAADKLKGGAG